MGNVDFKNITKCENYYEKNIQSFLSSLNIEKKYFNLDFERVKKFELTCIATANDEIIGITGLERKLGLVRMVIMISKDFHGQGLGKKFASYLNEESKINNYNHILAIVEENNYASFKALTTVGYKLCGKRENLNYIFLPLNLKGVISFNFIKIIFPIINFFDKLR